MLEMPCKSLSIIENVGPVSLIQPQKQPMQQRMMMVLLLLFLKLTVEQQKSEGKGKYKSWDPESREIAVVKRCFPTRNSMSLSFPDFSRRFSVSLAISIDTFFEV